MGWRYAFRRFGFGIDVSVFHLSKVMNKAMFSHKKGAKRVFYFQTSCISFIYLPLTLHLVPSPTYLLPQFIGYFVFAYPCCDLQSCCACVRHGGHPPLTSRYCSLDGPSGQLRSQAYQLSRFLEHFTVW